MRYRKLTSDGDYSFGQGPRDFLVNTPEAVGQLVKTRMQLFTGEWFLNLLEGLPYNPEVLGMGTGPTYDAAIRQHIRETQGVLNISEYNSLLDRSTRHLTATAKINTIYGSTVVTSVVPTSFPSS